MSTETLSSVQSGARPQKIGFARTVKAYVSLTKPRVMELLLVVTVPAMILAEGGLPNLWLVLATLLGGAMSAGSAGSFNCYIDRDMDRRMKRTSKRPLVTGEISDRNALVFSWVLGVLSVAWLWLTTNWLAAALSAAAIFFYVVIYTLLLKRHSEQNIIWGGIAGCFPVLIGWAAVTGSLDWPAWIFFLIIFLWTPPHFWALALYRNGDYERVSVPMMTVVAGPRSTRRQIFLYSIAVFAVAVAPAFTSIGGLVYLIIAGALSLQFLRLATIVGFRSEEAAEADGHKAEKRLFKFSILWLFLIFSALTLEAGLRAAGLSIAIPGFGQ